MVHHAHAVSPEDRHQRVHRVVRLYADKIKAAVTDEAQADVWFVVVPDEVYASCRPESVIPKDVRKPFETSLGKGIAKKLVAARSFFEELNDDATPYKYQPHFHNQLKALWLEDEVPMQVIRESTIAPNDFLNPMGYPKRKIGLASKIAWNLCTAAFYKSGARPWKLAEVRSGVCWELCLSWTNPS
jgi:hypothetical protein